MINEKRIVQVAKARGVKMDRTQQIVLGRAEKALEFAEAAFSELDSLLAYDLHHASGVSRQTAAKLRSALHGASSAKKELRAAVQSLKQELR